jgi:hypothetical protein
MSRHDRTRLGGALIVLGLALAVTVAARPLVALAGLVLAWLGVHLYARGGDHESPRADW